MRRNYRLLFPTSGAVLVLMLLFKQGISTDSSTSFSEQVPSLNSRQRVFPHQRNLELKCPITNDEILYGSTGSNDDERNKLNSYSEGYLSRNVITKFRHKSPEYYQTVVNNVIMATCNLKTHSERCVPVDSSMAAKDWNNTCIVAANFKCPIDTCERASNCYWSSVHAGQNRTTRFPPEEYPKAQAFLTDHKDKNSYVRELATPGAIGIIVAIVLFVMWFFFFVGRYCCCCLWTSCGMCYICSPIPNSRGYNKTRQWVFSIVIYVVGFTALIASATVAFVGNDNISATTTNSFAHMSGLVEDMGRFLRRSRMPLSRIQSIANVAAVDAKSTFNDTGYISDTAGHIVSSFSDFASLHSGGLAVSNAQSEFDSAIYMFSDQLTPVVDEIQYMLDTLEDDFYNKVDFIQAGLSSAVGQIDSFSEMVVEWQVQLSGYESKEYSLRTVREMCVLSIFLISLTISAGGILGIICAKPKGNHISCLFRLLHLAGFFSALIGTLALILASITLSVGFVWNDVCEMSKIVTNDFEPLVGDRVALGANAMFDNTNLAVAFNVTDKVNFQGKLEDGLSVIRNVNITEKFRLVLGPLEDIQLMIDTISPQALGVFLLGTTFNQPMCPFNDVYTEATILKPWTSKISKNTTTNWILRDTGAYGNYTRQGDENGTAYISRIYNAAGSCARSNDCCLNGVCGQPGGSFCNSGADCVYACSELRQNINMAYAAYLDAYGTENQMTSDLGVVCPNTTEYHTCPTLAFNRLGHNRTLVSLIDEYRMNITETADDLVDIATSSVGETMNEVQKFLCNMNVSFVASRYEEVRDEVCGAMFGGFAQVNWALWGLAITLQVMAILAYVLSTRLRGETRADIMARAHYERPTLSKAELYGRGGKKRA